MVKVYNLGGSKVLFVKKANFKKLKVNTQYFVKLSNAVGPPIKFIGTLREWGRYSWYLTIPSQVVKKYHITLSDLFSLVELRSVEIEL